MICFDSTIFLTNFQQEESTEKTNARETQNSAENDFESSKSDCLNETSNENVFIDLSFEATNDNEVDNNDADELNTEAEIDLNNDNIENSLKIRNKFKWSTFKKFDELDDAFDFLEEEGFVCYDDSDLKMGQKFYFRCKKTPKAVKPYCACRYVLFLPAGDNDIILQHNGLEHDHKQLMADKKKLLSDEMINYIDELFEKGVTQFKQITKFIDDQRIKHCEFIDEPNPTARQVEYRLKLFRNRDVKPMINVGDVMQWCEENSTYPANDTDPFVLGYECSSLNEPLSFRFCVTTPLLLQFFIGLTTIAIDATYKLNWNGFPLIVLGTIDRQKKFHPLLYACTSRETTCDYSFVFETLRNGIEVLFGQKFLPEILIADGADAIRNAYYQSFDTAKKDIMCFAHVLRNIKKRKFSSKATKSLIIDDIRAMQSAASRPIFNMLSKLFCTKWRQNEPDFVKYFEKQWLGAHSNWFEGAAQFTPSTNNGVESHNAAIKRKITLRRRLPFNQFVCSMKTLVNEISMQFNNGERMISTEPKVSKKMRTEAAAMCQNHFKSFKAKSSIEDQLVFMVPSTKCDETIANEKHYRSLVKRNWESFDEYIVHGHHKFYIVQLCVNTWTESNCTCVSFFKQNVCKHIIAIGMQRKLIVNIDTANPTLLGKRKTGGRAPNATHALSRE